MFDNEIRFIETQGLTTPVTFFNEKNLLQSLDLLRSELPSAAIHYALKSCYNPPLLKALVKQKLGVEVLSELEFDLARSMGFESIILNGMGRSRALLEKAVTAGATIIVDTMQDIDHLGSIRAKNGAELHVGIRLVPKSTDFPQNAYLHSSHPLGTTLESTLIPAFMQLCALPGVHWEMLHTHFTINELSPDIYDTVIRFIATSLHKIEDSYGLRPRVINLGGGYEVYDPEAPSLHRDMFARIRESFQDHLALYDLAVEPGRYLSAYAGYTIGKVVDIKMVENKCWLIGDIGTNTLIPIPNARYRLRMPAPAQQGGHYGLTDGITSPANNVIEEFCLRTLPAIGDYICVGNTGAYTDVYSTFWAYTPQNVCFVDNSGKITPYRTDKDLRKLYDVYFH